MPRSPDDPVVRDSGECLWNVFREGLYVSSEVTESGHWNPQPESAEWARRVQVESPLGRFSGRFGAHTLSIVPPPTPPTPSAEPHVPRVPLGEIHLNVLRAEVAMEERGSAARAAARAAALRKIEEGVRDLKLADQL